MAEKMKPRYYYLIWYCVVIFCELVVILHYESSPYVILEFVIIGSLTGLIFKPNFE